MIDVSITPGGPLRAGATYDFHLVLTPRVRLAAGASLRIGSPLGWSPFVRGEQDPGAVAWHSAADALLLGDIVRRRYLQLNITGGTLRVGDAVHVAYKGARVQPWVMTEHPVFLVEVDQPGDGVFADAGTSSPVPVEPAQAAFLHVVLPSVAEPGQPVQARAVILDTYGNQCRGIDATGRWSFSGGDGHDPVAFTDSRAEWQVQADDPGPIWLGKAALERCRLAGVGGHHSLPAQSRAIRHPAGRRVDGEALWRQVHLRVLGSELGEDVGLLGTAALAWRGYESGGIHSRSVH